jgi:hypothetical protein
VTPSKPITDPEPEKPGGKHWKLLSTVPYDQSPPIPAAAQNTPSLPSDDTATL